MCLIIFFVIFGVVVVIYVIEDVKMVKGFRFLGVGYNILKGNFDGG